MRHSLPFVSLRPPFADFVLVHGAEADIAAALPPPLRPSAASLPANCRLYISDWGAGIRWSDDGALLIGIARIGSTLAFGPAEVRYAALGLPRLVGQCAVFTGTRKALELRSDFLGLMPLFHARFGEDFVCSNRVHLIAIAARALGHGLALSYDFVATNIFVDSIWCTQIGTRHLPIEGVRMLRPGEAIEIKQRRAKILRAPPIERGILEPGAYHDLIKAGAAEVMANVAAAIDAANPGLLIVDLTGGRDSRIVLAAIVALGRIDDVRFTTSDAGDPADLEVASGLADHFGARFMTGEAMVETRPTDADDVLHLHRSIFFGLYHDMKLPLSRPVDPAARFVGVGGGCGELYRDFWQKVLAATDARTSTDIGEAVIRFLRQHGSWESFPKHLKEYAPDLFAREIRRLDGDTLGQKLDLHYLAFRNRLHFGLSGTIGSLSGITTFLPLASPSLLAAARGLPEAEKSTARVVFDVTCALCPVMPHLPYSHDPWPDMTASAYHRPSPYDGAALTLKPGREAWETAQRERARRRPAGSRSLPKAVVLDRILEAMPEMIAFVRAEGGSAGSLLPPTLMERVTWLRGKESKFQRFWYSRVAAMMDTLAM